MAEINTYLHFLKEPSFFERTLIKLHIKKKDTRRQDFDDLFFKISTPGNFYLSEKEFKKAKLYHRQASALTNYLHYHNKNTNKKNSLENLQKELLTGVNGPFYALNYKGDSMTFTDKIETISNFMVLLDKDINEAKDDIDIMEIQEKVLLLYKLVDNAKLIEWLIRRSVCKDLFTSFCVEISETDREAKGVIERKNLMAKGCKILGVKYIEAIFETQPEDLKIDIELLKKLGYSNMSL